MNNLGYLVKRQDEKDKRIVYLSLSPKALNIIFSVTSSSEDKFLDRFNVLSQEELVELSESFLNVQNLIIKMRDLNDPKRK